MSRPERAAYEDALTGVYFKRIRVSLLDRTGRAVADLSPAFMGGAVTVDTNGDVDRSTSIQVLDPTHRFGFDADTYQGGDLDLSRMLRVWWVVADAEGLARPISVPVHTGPVTRLQRNGPVVSIEAQGKEVYGLQPARRTRTIRKGTKRTDALRTLARDFLGETRMTIPDLPARLGDDLVVRPADQPWPIMQSVAQSLARQLFYDGAGTLVLRTRPGQPMWTFADRDGGGLISPPQTDTDLGEVINHVKVVGRKPKGKKQPVAATASADPGHPLAPQNLGPAGAPLFLTETITNDKLRTVAECRRAAEARLTRGLRLAHATTADVVPIPHADPGDLVTFETRYETVSTELDAFTLPLGLGGHMQIGYTDPYRLTTAKRRATTRGRRGGRRRKD